MAMSCVVDPGAIRLGLGRRRERAEAKASARKVESAVDANSGSQPRPRCRAAARDSQSRIPRRQTDAVQHRPICDLYVITIVGKTIGPERKWRVDAMRRLMSPG